MLYTWVCLKHYHWIAMAMFMRSLGNGRQSVSSNIQHTICVPCCQSADLAQVSILQHAQSGNHSVKPNIMVYFLSMLVLWHLVGTFFICCTSLFAGYAHCRLKETALTCERGLSAKIENSLFPECTSEILNIINPGSGMLSVGWT